MEGRKGSDTHRPRNSGDFLESDLSGKPHEIPVAKLLKDVEKSYDLGVKLLDASDKQTRERNGEGAYSDADVSFESDPWSRAWGETMLSKKQQKAFAEKERERMRSTVERLARQMGLEVRVVEDGSTLLEEDKERGERKSKSKGWYDTETGRITVVVGNHSSAADIEKTMLHEGVAHHGLRELFGKKFDDFLDAVYDNAENAIKEKIALLASRNGWSRRVATEEYLASLAEETDFEETEHSVPGWWMKLKNLFMDFLRNCGFDINMKLSGNELRYVLWMSWKNLQNPGMYKGFLGEAERVAKQFELKVGEYAEESSDFRPQHSVASEETEAEAGLLNELNDRFNEQLKRYEKGEIRANEFF